MQNLLESQSGYAYVVPKLYAKYHEAGSSNSLDIFFTMQNAQYLYILNLTISKSEIEYNPYIKCKIWSKVYQVIFVSNPNIMPNILKLAQAILQIFFSTEFHVFWMQNIEKGG